MDVAGWVVALAARRGPQLMEKPSVVLHERGSCVGAECACPRRPVGSQHTTPLSPSASADAHPVVRGPASQYAPRRRVKRRHDSELYGAMLCV